MRIGIFTDQYLPNMSGMVTSIINLRAGLEALGHEVFIIAPANKKVQDDDHVIRIFSVDPRVFIGNPFAIPTRGKLKELVDLKLDIVHIQEIFSIGALGHAVAKKSGSKLVLSVHTQWDMLYKHYPTSVIAAAIGIGAAYPVYFGLRSTLPVYLLEDGGEASFIGRQFGRNLVIFANACDIVISPSEHVLEKLVKFRCKVPVVHIPNSIQLEKIDRSLFLPRQHKRSMKFVILGRVSREKRQYVAIEAFAKALKKVDAELFIIGDGPDLERCYEYVNKLGLQDRVHFLGNTENTVAKQLLADADVMVLASHNFDNQPMVILESLAAGVGILYCDPQLRDGLTTKNALLTGHTVSDLTDGFIQLASNPKLVRSMASESKKLAKSYSTKTISKRVENVYKELLQNHK